MAAERSKASDAKCWCRGYESRRWKLAVPAPSSGKTCCSIKGQSFSYYVYVVWEVKEPLSINVKGQGVCLQIQVHVRTRTCIAPHMTVADTGFEKGGSALTQNCQINGFLL